MIVYLLLAVVGALAGVVLGAKLATVTTVEVLRTELNSSRTNEQLLLTRLASRTPAEFHAVTSPPPASEPDTSTRVVWDETGLIEAVLPRADA